MKKTLIARWSLVVFLMAAGAAAQNDANQATFPLHGQVVAAYTSGDVVGSAGITGTVDKWVYRVDCGDLYYDLQGGGKRLLNIDQQINFRMDGEKAYLSGDKNGKSYRIVGLGKASQELIHRAS